jgi:hypothetical protein
VPLASDIKAAETDRCTGKGGAVMPRYIDADALAEYWFYTNDTGTKVVELLEIEQAPTVDAEPVRHGRWIKRDIVPDYMWKYCCSCCHSDGERRYNYCPHCGAKMDEGVE